MVTGAARDAILSWYAWQGSNLRPSVPETDALIQLSYRRIPVMVFELPHISKRNFPSSRHVLSFRTLAEY